MWNIVLRYSGRSLNSMKLPEVKYCLLKEKDKILYITINRPEVLNSLSHPASDELSSVWDFFEKENELRVAILTGKGTSFSAGFDLQWFAKQKSLTDPIHTASRDPTGFGRLTHRKSTKPIIAAVNGYAFGGGFELALACDIVIAVPEAKFGLPEPKVGLAALGGGLVRLPRLVGYQRAMNIILTARTLTSKEVLDLGIISEIVPADNLINRATEIAELIIKCSPDSILLSKRIAIESLENASVRELLLSQNQLPEFKALFKGSNLKEGITAFNEKRKPNWNTSKL